MTAKRLFYGLVFLIAVFCGGLFFAAREANHLLDNKAAQVKKQKADLIAVQDQQDQLTVDRADVKKYKSLNLIAETVVPQDKNQAQAVRQIAALAAQSGIPQLSSITFPPSTLGGSLIQSSTGLTQVTKVKGIPGVFDLQITISQSTTDAVPYNDFLTFLTKLEQNRRTAIVSSISIEPVNANPSTVAFNLVLEEFIKP